MFHFLNEKNRSTPQGSPERTLFEQKDVQAFVEWLEDLESSSEGEEDDDDDDDDDEDDEDDEDEASTEDD